MRAHYVNYLYPGSFMSETSREEITGWDTEMAMFGARQKSRKPFAFYFTTRGRSHHELDSREIARSGLFYLGGTVESLQEIESRRDPRLDILLSNMRGNGWSHVIRTPYGNHQPFGPSDTVLE